MLNLFKSKRVTKLEKEVRALENNNQFLEEKIGKMKEELDEISSFMQTAKLLAKETPKNKEIQKKMKWLNGYPDESKKEV